MSPKEKPRQRPACAIRLSWLLDWLGCSGCYNIEIAIKMGAQVKYLEQPGLSEKASSLEEARTGRSYTDEVPAQRIPELL